ncbi:hypothetical protein LJ707_18460 [Mucilaginibacter sp. UR6-1]|uniref:hypothetical protein n=1 Tax=Mucilaginibacter sp. UR6-1 TaxID=1435643 RepID=UPI001E46D6D6|nr:hypothetical protein [Mucilaginibacter sp. UR6-1]MCC8410929.1 hypothetical protein [Mucilaginibacter sp. UR6-1]
MRYPVIVISSMRVAGMALYPFILVNNKDAVNDATLLNHERIHLKQQREMLVIFFYIAYLLNYFINLIKYCNHHKAYLNIVFEREAYKNEQNLVYLKQRGFWWWRFYL